jgi:hypothetical protein
MNNMKVLFLDHDGVICLQRQWGTRYNKQDKLMDANKDWVRPPMREIPIYDRFDDFDQGGVDVLNQIILETDCQIVVSSDWRLHATVDEMGDYYESQGIIRRPIGFTPIGKQLDRWDRGGGEEIRAGEIMNWLSEWPQVTHWVAVDDLDMRRVVENYSGIYERDWGLHNFVWTMGWGDFGIKDNKINDIIKYLT